MISTMAREWHLQSIAHLQSSCIVVIAMLPYYPAPDLLDGRRPDLQLRVLPQIECNSSSNALGPLDGFGVGPIICQSMDPADAGWEG
jgi:hypothetical protein